MDNQLFTRRKQSVITGTQQALLLGDMMREDWSSFRTRSPGADVFYPANCDLAASAGTNFTPALGVMYAVPLISPRRSRLAEFGVFRQGGVLGESGRFGLYRATEQDNLYPRSLIYDSGLVPLPPASTFISVQPNIVLEEGWLYWVAFVRQTDTGSTFLLQSWATNSLLFAFERLRPTAANPAANVGLTTSGVMGALPTTFPTGATRIQASSTSLFVLCRFARV